MVQQSPALHLAVVESRASLPAVSGSALPDQRPVGIREPEDCLSQATKAIRLSFVPAVRPQFVAILATVLLGLLVDV